MSGPSGLGMFVWQPGRCEGGDFAKLAAKAGRLFEWIALHESWNAAMIAQLHAQGLWVGVSMASVPGVAETAAFIVRTSHALEMGADGILVDGETAWESKVPGATDWPDPAHPGRHAEAAAFAQKLRRVVGDQTWIGNAGAWQWPRAHPLYPDAEFGASFDAAMPERYWTEFQQNTSYIQAILESEREWAATSQLYKSVIPIGSCYGTNGPVPGGHQPLLPADLENFVKRYPTCALWSWMHVPAFAWAMFEARAAANELPLSVEPAQPNITPDAPNTDDDPEGSA